MIRAAVALAILAWSTACRPGPARPYHPGPATHPRPGLDARAGWIRFVDPFIGTDDGDSPDPPPGDKGGAVFPGATTPFGMIQWSPDTGPHAEFSYQYRDDHVRGFSVNHLSGPGCAALLDFPFLPTSIAPTDATSVTRARAAAKFRHADELALPGYYKTVFASGLTTELTARPRAGFARFTFPPGPAGILVEAGKTVPDALAQVTAGELHLISPTQLAGTLTSERFCGQPSRYQVHLVATFDHPVIASAAWRGSAWTPGARAITGPRGGLWLAFDPQTARALGVTIAISYVSLDGAAANLAAETAEAPTFDEVRANAARAWNAALGRIAITGGREADLRTFYTALYHALLHPSIASDVTGEYAGFDGAVHTATGYTHYATFSGWDIYRSWIQLVTLVFPHQADDLVRSFVDDAVQCGGLPRWTLANDETGVMVGDPGAMIVANAYAFGARGFDAAAALRLATAAALPAPGTAPLRCNQHEVRPHQALYDQLGYLPTAPDGRGGFTAITLEYAAADFAIGQLARALGEPALASELARRSERWRNVIDPGTGYARPRDRAGVWRPDFTPAGQRGFIEGNAAQYTWFVPHALPALATLLGGEAAAIARLDALFLRLNAGVRHPYFYIGNEPQFGTPFAYDHLGAPSRTQATVRRIVTSAFSDQPTGLPGNDDLGALSSWYVWAALGLYPDVPGVPGLAVASPLFPRATLTLRDGTLTIDAPAAAPGSPYVHGLALDGVPLDSPWIPLAKLQPGRTLRFALSPTPDPTWGQTRPPRTYE